jgi:hypothetical protein
MRFKDTRILVTPECFRRNAAKPAIIVYGKRAGTTIIRVVLQRLAPDHWP